MRLNRGLRLRKQWFYPLSLLGVIILSTFVFSYNLGRDFFEDEYQVNSTAYGYLQTGDFFLWDWIGNRPEDAGLDRSGDGYYPRAWPHTALVALSYSLFGVSEESSRIISILFSVIFVGTSYFFTRFFIGRNDVALGVAFSLALSSSVIVFQAQYTRMYALLAPLFLLFAWSMYRGITEKSIKSPQNGVQRYLERNCNFHFGYIGLSLGLLALNYTIHINSLILLPATYLFVLYLAVTSRERRYVFLVGVGAIALLVLTYIAQSSETLEGITYWLTPFRRRNLRYLDFVVGYPFRQIGTVLLFAGLAGSFFIKDKELKNRRIFLYSIVGFTLCFFVLIADRYAAYKYTSHVMPIGLALVLAAFFYVIGRIRSAAGRGLSCGLFVGWIIYLYVANFGVVYGDENDRAHYSEAYATIVDTFNPGQDVIFGQYLRDFYLQDLPPETKVIRMLNGRRYTLEQFQADLSMEQSGFVTWASRKEQHLSKELRQYIHETSRHLHGTGVDDTKVEVYYFEN